MNGEPKAEMADWERARERESALGCFGCAVEDLKVAVAERIRHEIAGPILDYLVGSPIRLYGLAALLLGFLLMLTVLSWPGK